MTELLRGTLSVKKIGFGFTIPFDFYNFFLYSLIGKLRATLMSLSLVSSAHLWKLIKQFPNTFIIHHWFPPTLSSVALCGNGFLYKSGNGKKRKVSIPWNYIDSGNSTENNFFFCFQRNRRSSSKSRTSGGSCLETDQSFIFFANSPFCNSKHCSLQSRSFRVKGWRSFPIKVFKTEVAEEPANSFHYSFTLICLMAFDQSSKPIQAEECQVRSSISFFRPINAKRLQLVEIAYLKFTINLQICILFVSRWPVISERPCKQSIVQVRIKTTKNFFSWEAKSKESNLQLFCSLWNNFVVYSSAKSI